MDHTQFEHLINWANAFDSSLLQSEDDVETKFVLPFFRYLGYPEECRRGKYPVNTYQPGKPGRKQEVDHIYFSVSEPDKQNADTALVLVEAKRVQTLNLEDAVIQAEHYGESLKPLFIVATNGYCLKVLKRHRHHSNEVVFDITIQELRDRNIATEVYNQLQFETVKRLKEQAIDPMTHAQYVQIMQALDNHPDIQAQLAKGDFEPSTKLEGRQLIVVKPKVAITCELPIAFEEGSCRIEFSNIMLRGLTCHLSHSEILTELFIGLDTSPAWETRPFLQTTEQGTFEAHLGQTTVILSENEASDLCDAVDVVCQKYKDILVETTNNLETWDYRPVSMENIKGFEILSVERWLWDLMKQFSREFDYDKGNSGWHIFDSHHAWAIRVARKGELDHVVIWPKFGNRFFPNNKDVELLYVDSITFLQLYRDKPYHSIFKDVGPHGIWTATYTKEWIEQQFIPKVLAYYLVSPSLKRVGKIRQTASKVFPFLKPNQEQINVIMKKAVTDYSEKVSLQLADIEEPKQFSDYLHYVQSWFHHYHYLGTYNVPASLLRPYYAAFTDLAQYIDSTTINMDYIRGNLGAVGLRTEKDDETNSPPNLSTYSDMINFLKKQVERINKVDVEYNLIADLLSRTFITIIEGEVINIQQKQINIAKDAVYHLYEQCRFDYHFIEPLTEIS